MSRKRRIALLTGGGDCPGLNAVIRAVTRTAIHDHGFLVDGVEDGFDGLVRGMFRPLTSRSVSGILDKGGTILGTSNVANPFRYPVKRGGGVITADCSDRAIANARRRKVDVLVCVGGDGTSEIASRLSRKGLPVIVVPKTIDNDVRGTDRTFGFDSAVHTATLAIDALHTTADAHRRVMVIEVMGRYAGWIALSAGIAGGGDVILIPEIPFRMDRICRTIDERHRRENKRFSIVVVAEGARSVDGERIVRERVEASTDPVRLGGIGAVVAARIQQGAGVETRVTVLGHLQRGGSPTPFDRILATRFGAEAVRLAEWKRYNHMVALRGDEIVSVPIRKIVGGPRTVPVDSPLIRVARGLGVSLGD